MDAQNHLDYLFKSLQHHPSPYIICEKDGTIKWVNLSAEFVFRLKKISEIKSKTLPGICRVVASKSHLNEDTKKFISDIQDKVELIQAGSSLKFLKIAEGKADLYPRLGPTSEWDTAAAHAIPVSYTHLTLPTMAIV